MSYPGSLSRDRRDAAVLRLGNATRTTTYQNAGLNDHNPYSFNVDGWCEPTQSRAEQYDRHGPPADPRAGGHSASTSIIEGHLAALLGAPSVPVAWDRLYARFANHPRRSVVAPLFVAGSDEDTAAVVRELRALKVRDARGATLTLEQKIRDSACLTADHIDRILRILVEVRRGWLFRDVDAGYDDVNWKHACDEVAQLLDIAADRGLPPDATEEALLASVFSDSVKLKNNFLTHHVDGCVAAALVLPRFFGDDEAARHMVVRICQSILEHQVGPPRFMAKMVKSGIDKALRASGMSSDGLDGLAAKIADPLNPAHTALDADGVGALQLTPRELHLLALVGLPAWWVPHPQTPWFAASSTVIDADSVVNYATPDGVGKIVAICGPDTPFDDATIFHSIFSCGASFVDAVSVMSDVAVRAVQESVQRTRTAIDEVRSRVNAEIQGDGLAFTTCDFAVACNDDDIDRGALDLTQRDDTIRVKAPRDLAVLPYWSIPLEGNATQDVTAFAKVLRRRVVDLLREK